MGDYERVRLVTLGGPQVGKSSIVKRFLFNTYRDKYKATVEDLYSQDYDFGQLTLKVDILDTAGDLQFPAMRRLSIATAHAFLIVYSVDCRESFELAKVFFDEIQEQRGDFQDTPIVLTGNKVDLFKEGDEQGSDRVRREEVADWLEECWPSLKVKSIECSAKEDLNIRDIFRSFLTLSKLSFAGEDNQALKRRSSAHAGSKSPAPSSRSCSISKQGSAGSGSGSPGAASPSSSSGGMYGMHFHRGSSGTPPTSPSGCSNASGGGSYQQFLTTEESSVKSKPRSRSLIRRCSKKVKQQVRDASTGPGDCQMS